MIENQQQIINFHFYLKYLNNMKRFLTIVLIMTTLSSYSQNIEEKIQLIRNHFSEIESAISKNQYESKTEHISNEAEGVEGSITKYYEGKKLRKIVSEKVTYSENLQKTSYYVWDGKLFFAYHVSQAPKHIDATQTEYHHTENRYYFHDEAPIRCLVKYFVVKPDSNKKAKELSANTANKEKNCNKAKNIIEKFKRLK